MAVALYGFPLDVETLVLKFSSQLYVVMARNVSVTSSIEMLMKYLLHFNNKANIFKNVSTINSLFLHSALLHGNCTGIS